MIPKKIHYCWFGESKMPDTYISYISEWRELHPGWEIMQWDETNSPMDIAYMQSAKNAGNWANMSNFVRFFALLKFGGIYLDTDMKVIKPMDSLLSDNCFFGFESGNIDRSEFWVNNAIFGATPNHSFVQLCYDSILEKFDGLESANISAPQMVTKLLKEEKGLVKYGLQELKGIKLYPVDFFYPIDYNDTFKLKDYKKHITDNTIAIHMWGRSWMSKDVLLMFIDDLQRIAHTNKLQIDQLNSSLIETNKEKENIQELLKNTEQINASHVYDKGLLNEEINSLKNTVKNLSDKVEEITQININHVYDKKLLTQEIDSLKSDLRNSNHASELKIIEIASLQKKLTYTINEFVEKEKLLTDQIQFLKENIQSINNANKLIEEEYQSKIKQIVKDNSTILSTKDSLIAEAEKLINLKNDVISDWESTLHLKVKYFQDQKKILENENLENKQRMNFEIEEKDKTIYFLEKAIENYKKSPINKLKHFCKKL